MRFNVLTTTLEKIYNGENAQKKAKIFQKFIDSFNSFRTEFIKDNGNDKNASFYPILRLILPQSDNERDSYGMRTTTLGKYFVKGLAIPESSADAKKLMAQQGMTSRCKDYAEIVFEVMKGRSPEMGSLDVFEVNQYLDMIASHYKNNERKSV